MLLLGFATVAPGTTASSEFITLSLPLAASLTCAFQSDIRDIIHVLYMYNHTCMMRKAQFWILTFFAFHFATESARIHLGETTHRIALTDQAA